MPTTITDYSGGAPLYASALIGEYQTLAVKVDVSALTNTQVDANGYLKPNVPLSLTGVTPSGATNEVPCVTVEAVKVSTDNSGGLATAVDPLVACAVSGVLNRDVMEDVLGRVLSAPEIAALNGPNSKLVLALT